MQHSRTIHRTPTHAITHKQYIKKPHKPPHENQSFLKHYLPCQLPMVKELISPFKVYPPKPRPPPLEWWCKTKNHKMSKLFRPQLAHAQSFR